MNIVVPDLGESVVEATVGRWLKKEGDAVSVGEAVVVLETDKVDLEVGAERDGVLVSIAQPEGTDVKIGDVLGVIEAGENGAAASASPAPKQAEAPTAQPQQAQEPAPPPQEGDTVAATPVAKRIANEQQIDLKQVTSSTPSGRVTKSDVQRYIEQQPAQTPAARETPPPAPALARQTPSAPAPVEERGETRIKMSRRRRTIAQRLVEAQRTAAMLTTFNEIDMSAVMELRSRRKDQFKERYGVSLGLSSFFVKAAIGALKSQPRINAEIQGDEIVMKSYFDIGVAIGADEGLVVPVLRDADRMSFAQIEQAIKDFAKQAADNTLSLDALKGGTFTITNGGVFGSLLSTPILNPPQVGILGLHKIEERPIALKGEVVIRPMMYVALSYDHRIVDGREAVQFLVRVKELVEDPESLLIEG